MTLDIGTELYIVYGVDHLTYLAQEHERNVFGLFTNRKKAESFAIKLAHDSFLAFNEHSPHCEYNADGTLAYIEGGDDYYAKPTEIFIDPVIVRDTNSNREIKAYDTAWIVFGTLDLEISPEFYPLEFIFNDPKDASKYMLREAYKKFEEYDVENDSIEYYTNGCAELANYPDGCINKIFDGDNWWVELRLVPMTIQ